MDLARSSPTVLTWFMDASARGLQRPHSGTPRPPGASTPSGPAIMPQTFVRCPCLRDAGCTRLFEEKRSGKAGTKRPELDAALHYLRPDDVLVVWKLDRLGRSLVEMMRTLDALRRQDV